MCKILLQIKLFLGTLPAYLLAHFSLWEKKKKGLELDINTAAMSPICRH